MKISIPAVILSGAGLGLTLVYSQQTAPDTPSKAQQILRQKMSELDRANSLPSKEELLGEVQRLHKEGKISDQQFDSFKKNINEQYVVPAGALSPEAQAKAQMQLEQKIAELNAGEKVVVTPANPEAQAAAEQVLRQKLNGPPAHPETSNVAEQVLQQKIAQFRTQERTNVVPATAGATLTPELEAKARELLRAKIAEGNKTDLLQPEPNPEAQARALAVLHQHEAELRAGVTPDTPEKIRVLRLKTAESKGIITPEDAAKAAAAPALATATPAAPGTPTPARVAASPATVTAPVPFYTSNKVGLARLHELTELYKADRITPYEYHHERAKIVASL